MNEIIDSMNDGFSKLVKEYLDKYFDSIMIEATYDESDENILLSSAIVVAGDSHVYDSEDDSMSIE